MKRQSIFRSGSRYIRVENADPSTGKIKEREETRVRKYEENKGEREREERKLRVSTEESGYAQGVPSRFELLVVGFFRDIESHTTLTQRLEIDRSVGR